MNRFVAAIAATASLPAGGLWWLRHRRAMGRSAVLVVDVEPQATALQAQRVWARLARAGADPLVAGVWLRLMAPLASWAAAEDLRRVVRDLVAADTPVWVWAPSLDNARAWVAAAATEVHLAPTGDVLLTGVGVELTFFTEALRRLGLEADVEAAGAYKSFGEPFTRDYASAAHREATQALVQALQAQLVEGVARGRGLGTDEVEDAMAVGWLSAEEARERGLIDGLAYDGDARDTVHRHLTALAGDDPETAVDADDPDRPQDAFATGPRRRARFVRFEDWARSDAVIQWVDGWGGGRRVEVLHLEGAIVDGPQGPGQRATIRAPEVSQALAGLREDDGVGAVVIHVESGGGHAGASDRMWREVQRLAAVKPVVACFGGVAASGGYYLAAPATEIVARANTLTGSIGVFGGKLVLEEGLRHLGIRSQEVSAAPHALLFSPRRRFRPSERARVRASMDRTYGGFVQRVSAGRRRPVEAVEPVCRGRVWTGEQARRRGLVDRIGNLSDAVARARVLAGLPADAPRVDRAPEGPTLAQVVVQAILRHRLFGADARSGPLLEAAGVAARHDPGLGDTLAAVGVLAEHPGQALALWPFTLQLDPRGPSSPVAPPVSGALAGLLRGRVSRRR